MVHRPSYGTHTLVADASVYCGYVAFPEYPVRAFIADDLLVVLEGRTYNKPPHLVNQELARLAKASRENHDSLSRSVRQWTMDTEGAYFVVMLDRLSRRLAAFSDPFCRLPTYLAVDDRQIVLSREMKFVRDFLSRPKWDPLACAQWLALGLPIGGRTFLEGVRAFPEAGLLLAEWQERRLTSSIRSLTEWDLDEEIPGRSVRVHARAFVDRFIPACRDWGSHPEAGTPVVSLSGGHDSRFVTAGMVRAGLPVQAVTYDDPNGRRRGEVTRASALALALGVPWRAMRLPPPSDADRHRLLRLKDGLNWSTMGYILPYLEQVLDCWGPRAVYLTGDGGNDCLNVLAPAERLATLDSAADFVVDNLTEIPPTVVEGLLRLPTGSLWQCVRDQLETYPETDLGRRVKHYKIFERGRRCYFEGEDRARFFLWQDSPFYSARVFDYCRRVPDRLKAHNVFCRAALTALSSPAAAIPVFPLGVAPSALFYPAANRLQEAGLSLPPAVRAVLRVLLRRPPLQRFCPPNDAVRMMLERVRRSPSLLELLDVDVLSRSILSLSTASQYYLLWTVLYLDATAEADPGGSML